MSGFWVTATFAGVGAGGRNKGVGKRGVIARIAPEVNTAIASGNFGDEISLGGSGGITGNCSTQINGTASKAQTPVACIIMEETIDQRLAGPATTSDCSNIPVSPVTRFG